MPRAISSSADPNATTHRWSDDEGISVFRTKSGYTGVDIGDKQPDMALWSIQTINEHGNRRVTRLEKNGARTVLADRFGRNDLVYA